MVGPLARMARETFGREACGSGDARKSALLADRGGAGNVCPSKAVNRNRERRRKPQLVGEGEKMAVQNARISTKDLDARLLAVEEKLSAIVEPLPPLDPAAQKHSAKAFTPNAG